MGLLASRRAKPLNNLLDVLKGFRNGRRQTNFLSLCYEYERVPFGNDIYRSD